MTRRVDAWPFGFTDHKADLTLTTCARIVNPPRRFLHSGMISIISEQYEITFRNNNFFGNALTWLLPPIPGFAGKPGLKTDFLRLISLPPAR